MNIYNVKISVRSEGSYCTLFVQSVNFEHKKGVRFSSNSLEIRSFNWRFRMGLNQRPPD